MSYLLKAQYEEETKEIWKKVVAEPIGVLPHTPSYIEWLEKKAEEVEPLKCCGNCHYYRTSECFCFHNWEPYKKCAGEGKYQWESIT